MSEGELRLSGESFDKLKNTVDDLSRSASKAKNALEKLFSLKWAEQQDWITNDRIVGQMEARFGHLNRLIDTMNAKLAITGARMANVFGGQASQIKEVAKALNTLNRAGSGGGRRGGGGKKGGGGWWNNEGFDPLGMGDEGEQPGDEGEQPGGGWKSNWVSRLDAVMSASKVKKKIAGMVSPDDFVRRVSNAQQGVRDKMSGKSADEMEKLKAYYRKLEAKQAEEEEALAEKELSARIKNYDKEQAETKKWWARLENLRREELAAEQKTKDAKAKRAAIAKAQAEQENSLNNQFKKQMGKLVEMGRMRFYLSQVMGTNFSKAAGMGGSGQGMLSRFGPGILGILGRYRVFQKPFPGSERNVFALGDLAASGQNIVGGVGDTVQRSFDILTSSAFAVNRAFSGVVSAAATLLPGMGAHIGAAIAAFSDMVIGIMEKLAEAVSAVIGSLGRLATAFMGFATRAVEAASSFTEAVNAARVVAGAGATREMQSYAIQLQRNFGVSATDLMRGMGRIAGQLRQQGGFAPGEAGFQAKEIARLVADISSVNNVPFENVMRDVMSGIVGRLTPLRKDMISMSAPVLDQFAKARGINNPALRTDYVARTRIFIEEFARQAGLFVGDLDRTRNEFANQRRKFLGSFEALFLTVGRILEPFGKTLLFAANDIMDELFDAISPLADDPANRFRSVLDTFSFYVAYAKNVIIEFAKRVFDARQQIIEWVEYLGRAFVGLASTLIEYSVNTLKILSNVIIKLGGLGPVIDMMSESIARFMAVVKWIAENREFFTNPLKAGAKAAALGNGEDGFGQLMQILAGKANNAANVLQKQLQVIQNAVGNVDLQAMQRDMLLFRERRAPVESKPGVIGAAPALPTAGNLVRYFSPEAFRDAVQERDVMNAQLQTAENTAKIVSILEKRPLAALPSVAEGGAGVLNRLVGKEAVITKP